MHSARHVHQVSYRYHATLHQWASGLPTLRLSAVPRCSVRSTDDDWASLFASEDTKEFSFAFQVRTRARCYTMMATSAEVSTRLCLSACPPTAPLPYVNIWQPRAGLPLGCRSAVSGFTPFKSASRSS